MRSALTRQRFVLFFLFFNIVYDTVSKPYLFLNGFAIVGHKMYVFFNVFCDTVFKTPCFFNAKLHDPNLGCEGMFVYKE